MSRRSATAAMLLVSWLVAGLALTAPVGASTETIVIKDTFKSASLSGSDGTHPWTSNWKELGENNGPSAGYVWVYGSAPCWSSYCLKMGGSGIEPNGIGAQRAADLSQGIGGKLCFDFRRELLGEPGGRFKVKISADGGKSWDVLETFNLDRTDDEPVHRLYELGEEHMTEGFVVGFFGAGQKASSYFAVDNVEIQVEIDPEPTTTEPPETTTTTTTTKPPATTTTTSTTTTTTVAPRPTTTTTTTTTIAPAPPPPDPPEDISEMARYTGKSDLAMTDLGASVAMIDLEAEPQLPERSPITQIVATMTTSAATVRLHLLPAIALGLLVSLFVIRGVAPEEQLEV